MTTGRVTSKYVNPTVCGRSSEVSKSTVAFEFLVAAAQIAATRSFSGIGVPGISPICRFSLISPLRVLLVILLVRDDDEGGILLLRLGSLGLVIPLLFPSYSFSRKKFPATLMMGTGRTRRKRWVAGKDIQLLSIAMSSNMAVAALTWESGIQGARRWTRPRIRSGRRRATARA